MKRSKIALFVAGLIIISLVAVDRFQTNQKLKAVLAVQGQARQASGDRDAFDSPSAADLKEALRQLEESRSAFAAATHQLSNLNAKVVKLERMVESLRNERSQAN